MIPVKTTDFANQIDSGQTVKLTFRYYSKNNNKFIGSLIKKVLERQNLPFLKDTVMTILRELIVNAVKANTKRYFFITNNMDISNAVQYYNGMKQFKAFMIKAGESISDYLKQYNLHVDLCFRKTEDGIKIVILNNTPLLPFELERINQRLTEARSYNDFSEVYEAVTDSSEGEGLGLLLTMLFLRNSGIGEKSFTIGSNGKITQTAITIPTALKPKAITSQIKNKIFFEIDSLPTIPEHIRELETLIAQKDVSMKIIADKIIVDPSLSASVLKLANSAEFITRNKADTIYDAVKMIGIKNLNMVLIASGAKSIMDKKFKSYKKIWEHCNRVAFYSRAIAIYSSNHAIADKVFLAGILHDLGKIILLSTSSTLNEWIAELTKKREIRTSTVIEEISIGISHSTIGEIISRKWNMPDYVTESIKYHHSPGLVDKEFKTITAIVYLADEMCNVETEKSEYLNIESDVLDMFNLHDEKLFNEFHEKIRNGFSNESIL